jgi:hypothetical protein
MAPPNKKPSTPTDAFKARLASLAPSRRAAAVSTDGATINPPTAVVDALANATAPGAGRNEIARLESVLSQATTSRVARMERLFNSDGELNASSKAEGLRLAQQIADNVRTLRRAARADASPQERTAVEELFKSGDAGRRVLAQRASQQIQNMLPYEGPVLMDYLLKRPLAGNEIFREQLPIRGTAVIVAQEAGVPAARVPDNLFVDIDTFSIRGRWEVSKDTQMYSLYDLMGQLEDTTLEQMSLEADARFFDMAVVAAAQVQTPAGYPSLSVSSFEDIRAQMEVSRRLRAASWALHRFDASDVFKTMASQVDFITQREWIEKGVFSKILGLPVRIVQGTAGRGGMESQVVFAPGTVFCFSDPEQLGKYGVRADVETQIYDGAVTGAWVSGAMASMNLGWAFLNPFGVTIGVRTAS